MDASYHRHDISDKVWSLLEPHLPGQRGQWGGIAQDNRRFINMVCQSESLLQKVPERIVKKLST